MADQGIKKTKISKSNLPPPFGTNSELYYEARYRIISDDKNRTSHWSNFEKINIPITYDEVGWNVNDPIATSIPNNIVINKSTHSIQLNWTMPSLLINNPTDAQLLTQKEQAAISSFDIYIQWRTGSNPGVEGQWSWINKVSGSNYSMTYLDTDPDYVRFRIQKVTQNKEILDSATYVLTDWHSV